MHRVKKNQNLPKITTLLAPVRLSPVPPANVEIKNMNISGELLNLSIMGMPIHHERHAHIVQEKGTYDLFVWYLPQASRSNNLYSKPVEKCLPKTEKSITVLTFATQMKI